MHVGRRKPKCRIVRFLRTSTSRTILSVGDKTKASNQLLTIFEITDKTVLSHPLDSFRQRYNDASLKKQPSPKKHKFIV